MSNEEDVLEGKVQDDEGTVTPDEGDGTQGTDATPEDDEKNLDPNITAGDDEQEDKGEFYEDEKQFLDQWDLPGKPETLENAMDRLQTLEEENNRLKAHDGPDRTTQQTPPEKPPSGKPSDNGQEYLSRGIFKQHVDDLVQSGQLSQENAQSWRQQASMNDAVLNPAFQQIEGTLNAIAGAVMNLGTAQRNTSWARFQHKNLGVDRQELDAVMDKRGLFDYNEALMQLAVSQNRPDLLGKIVTKAERRGEDKGRKRKLRRGTGIGRGRPQATDAPISKKYLNPDGSLDTDALNRLSTSDSLKITEQFLASMTKH